MALHTRLQAFGDLLARYRAVFAHAWNERHRRVSDTYEINEAQFLPAALSLQETPVSPAPRIAIALLCGFAFLALLWAIFGHMDIVATAQGKIVQSDRTKTIQSLETAAVKAIHVTEGEVVKAGQLLIELDATVPLADRERIASDLLAARLQSARAKTLLLAIEKGRLGRIEIPAGANPGKAEEAQQWVAGQYAELTARLGRISADFQRRNAELRSTEELVRTLELTVPIEQRRANDFKELVESDFVSRHSYLEREQARLDKEGNLANQRSRLSEIHAGLLESGRERQALLAETRRVALDSFNEAEQKAAELAQELVKAEAHGEQMRLVSPVDGTVQQLAVHTVGGVVTPAQPLMMIVPGDQPLEVEAFLENKDIGFVNPGHEAEVKIETFQYTKYGTIHAKVTHVSQDAIADEKRGLIYSMRVKLDRATVQVENKLVHLAPGMAATVEVKTGKRRVIEFFLSPLLQYQDESLRER